MPAVSLVFERPFAENAVGLPATASAAHEHLGKLALDERLLRPELGCHAASIETTFSGLDIRTTLLLG